VPAQKFKNTFASHVSNKELTIHDVVLGLYHQAFFYDKLPAKIRKAVDEEMKRRFPNTTI
jgi:hypothetical protein